MCMLYRIRCNLIHPLCGALHVPDVAVQVTQCALVVNQYTYVPTHCRTSQYHRTFILPLSSSLWNDLADPVFDGVGLAGFKRIANSFLLAYAVLSLFSLLQFPLSLISFGWHCGAGVFLLIGSKSLSPTHLLRTFFKNNNKIVWYGIPIPLLRVCVNIFPPYIFYNFFYSFLISHYSIKILCAVSSLSNSLMFMQITFLCFM